MINFPKNLFVKLFVWTCTIKFWQACRIVVAKNTKKFRELQKSWSYSFFNKILFSIKNDSLATENAFLTTLAKTFSKNPQIYSSDSESHEKNCESFEKKITFLKRFLCTCKMQLWPPCQNFLVKTLKNFCGNSGNDEKLIRIPRNLFVKTFIWTCTMKFRQAWRNFVAKNLKNFPELQKRWIYKLLNKLIFFTKNDSLATENAILTTLAKTFSENPQICSSGSENHEKNDEFFERKITFVKKSLCTCKMKLWPPCRNFLVKTLKNFCRNSGNDEKLIRIPRNLLVKTFIRTCTMKFRQACRNFVAKNLKNFPELEKCWIYNLLNKLTFFIKNDSLATDNAILTTLAKAFS